MHVRRRVPGAPALIAVMLCSAALPAAAVAGAAVVLQPQTDGVNSQRVVKVSLYCNHPGGPCTGTLKLTASGATIGSVALNAESGRTTKVPVRISKSALNAIRRHGRRLAARATVTLSDGTSYSQRVTLKI